MQDPSDGQPEQATAGVPLGERGGGLGEPAVGQRTFPPAPTPEEIAARVQALTLQWRRRADAAARRGIPREFGAGRRVESLWWRAALLSERCPLVCVSSADGGVGRSALTAALGGLLALAVPDPVVAVDATLRAWGGLEHRVVRRSSSTVWDAVTAGADLAAGSVAERLTQVGPTGLRVLVGESKLSSKRRPPTWPELFGVVAHLRAVFQLALLDLPTAHSASTWRALSWATVPVLVSRATVDSVQHTLRLLAHMRTAGLTQVPDRAVVVVMATSPSVAREVRAVEQLARQSAAVLVRVPYDPTLVHPDPLDPRVLTKATRSALTEVAAAVVDRCPADPVAANGPRSAPNGEK
ncbi:MinD-like ATPase involved in chromosome partitioning or flagellar assembly [Micromonospora peucetia]|uniref:MinD-like ATPase involved in chromosome partitioning or flagellar assembly n=1 Tax=Micromonospora peucetia TaxID=47871 RepID=A0A1C6W591_9ACTN|nr:MinD-like ATPase involved in chromosome partitioning or flagellar assembly [Micromonospora peucetia]